MYVSLSGEYNPDPEKGYVPARSYGFVNAELVPSYWHDDALERLRRRYRL